MGLMHLCDAAGDEAVKGLVALEGTVGAGNLKLAFFRGWEGLQRPDITELVIW